jgi:chorismate dehydratase
MNRPVRIACVEYLNATPFRLGIETFTHWEGPAPELHLLHPRDCAMALANDEVDLGLVPVAVIPSLKHAEVVTDYCIGAERAVESVCIYAEKPLNKLNRMLLDFQSLTSISLVQVLNHFHWKHPWIFDSASKDYINQIHGNTGGVVIGDRTFGLEGRFPVVVDLASEWHAYTGLPFVFAAWVANKPLDPVFLQAFNQALYTGLKQLPNIIAEQQERCIGKTDVKHYLTKAISYNLDQGKRDAMRLFLNLFTRLPQAIS